MSSFTPASVAWHGLSASVVAERHRWLTELTSDPTPGADERPR